MVNYNLSYNRDFCGVTIRTQNVYARRLHFCNRLNIERLKSKTMDPIYIYLPIKKDWLQRICSGYYDYYQTCIDYYQKRFINALNAQAQGKPVTAVFYHREIGRVYVPVKYIKTLRLDDKSMYYDLSLDISNVKREQL